MLYFKVRNFEQFQHYKDRRPPWIKIWYSLLNDIEFFRLPDSAKWHLVGIFLIASQHENCLPCDPIWIAHEIAASEPVDLDVLLTARFIEHCPESYRELREDWASRYIPNWLREKILARDHGCVLCRSLENPEVDHIVAISRGGKSEESNLQTLCRKCNRLKRFHPAQELPTQMRRTPCDSGETETETETEAEKETETSPKPPSGASSRREAEKAAMLKASEIFKHWNAQSATMHHRAVNGQEKAIVNALRHYAPEEIKRAIERYSQVRANVGGRYRDLYAWTLGEFLSRKNGYNVDRFNAEDWEQPFLGERLGRKETVAEHNQKVLEAYENER